MIACESSRQAASELVADGPQQSASVAGGGFRLHPQRRLSVHNPDDAAVGGANNAAPDSLRP